MKGVLCLVLLGLVALTAAYPPYHKHGYWGGWPYGYWGDYWHHGYPAYHYGFYGHYNYGHYPAWVYGKSYVYHGKYSSKYILVRKACSFH